MSWQIVEDVSRRAGAPGGRDAVLVIDDDGAHTAGALLAAAEAIAVQLAHVTGPRPTIAVEAPNSRHTVALALAVGRLDGTLALLATGLGREEAAMAIADVEPAAVLVRADTAERWLDGDLEELDGLPGWRLQRRPARHDAHVAWGGGIVIGFTSGSTGRPKAIVHGERALVYATDRLLEAVAIEPGETVAAVTPLSAAPAFAFGPYLALRNGSPLVLLGRWDAAVAAERFAAHAVSWFMGVPTHIQQLAGSVGRTGRQLTAMRGISVGGGPMTAEGIGAAERTIGAPVLRMFGMSEALGHTIVPFDAPDAIRFGTEGRAFPGTEHRVVDADGVVCAAGATGEALVRGPSLLLGYADAGRLRAAPLGPDGHFATGDLIQIGEDGLVRVMGRGKNIIIRAGKNIDPTEVEGLLTAYPGVDEACVVPVPDPALGERAAAVLVAPGAPGLDLPALASFLADRGVSKFKWPEYVFVLDDLPRTATGKVARATVVELACAAVRSAATHPEIPQPQEA